MRIKLLALVISLNFSFSSSYQFIAKAGNSTVLNFSNSQLNIEEKDGFSRISLGDNSSTSEEGMPELPLYTSFFQMDPSKEYSVDYNVVSSHVISNIDIYPFQGHEGGELSRDFKIFNDVYATTNGITW